MFAAILFKIAKIVKQHKCLLIGNWLNKNNIPVASASVGNVHVRTADEIKRRWTRTCLEG